MRLLHHATDVSIWKYAEICENLQKIYRDLQQNTETRRIPVGHISYSSIGDVSLFNGIAHYGSFSRLTKFKRSKHIVHTIVIGHAVDGLIYGN